VPRKWIWTLCMATALLAGAPAAWAQTGSESENLLPATTKGFLSITNLSDLTAQWKKTQLGQLMDDPVMQPFAKDLRRQLQGRWTGLRDKLGLTLDDLEGVPGGELAVAMIELAPRQSAMCALVDVTGRQPQAQELLQKAAARLTGRGARQTTTTIAETSVRVFTLPQQGGQTYYFLKDNLLGAADNAGVVQAVLLRKAGQSGPSLAGVAGFRGVMKRCRKDAGDQTPQIRWFIEPISYMELDRANQADTTRGRTRRGKDMLDIMKNQGFTAIQGIGGFVSVDINSTQVLHRTAIYAPPPYQKSMKMLKFVNNADVTPPAWIPREIATYTTFYADLLHVFDNFGPLFDELFGEGETDVWKDTLEGLRDDPDGPRIDLRGELFANLGQRIISLSDYHVPITPTSERLLFAIEAKDEAKVTAAIKKAMEKDDTMRRRVFEGHVIWESVPPEKKPTTTPVIELGRAPALGPDKDDLEEDETPRLLPNQAITVANGYLMIASHYDMLTKILRPVNPADTLAKDLDYRVIEAANPKLGAGQGCLWAFSRTEDEYRPTYELIRQGKMPQSETLLARILNTFGGEKKDGTERTQQIDGSKMPDFDYVRRNLGPGGAFGFAEPDGWFIKGYILPKP
jgi:hypothetical protein